MLNVIHLSSPFLAHLIIDQIHDENEGHPSMMAHDRCHYRSSEYYIPTFQEAWSFLEGAETIAPS